MKALIPQGLTGRPNYIGLLNNLMTLIICESLREIGEIACATSAWSSRGQTLNLSSALVFKNLKTFLANALALISSLVLFGRLFKAV